MVKSLENLGIVPLQFRLDSQRPDLTKVDTLLGLLASECSFFPIQVDAVANSMHKAECRLEAALEQMKDLPFPEQLVTKQEEYMLFHPRAQNFWDLTLLLFREVNEEEVGKGKQKLVSDEPPEEFLCPITQELMRDPVVASDGHTYEKYEPCNCVGCWLFCSDFASRVAIEEWIQKKAVSPMTNVALETKLYPNYSLKSRIAEWREQLGTKS